MFLANAADGRSALIDFKANRVVREFTGLSGDKETTVKHPNDSLIISTSTDGTLKAIDLKTNLESFSLKRNSPVTALAFSPQGDKFFVGNAGGIIEEIEFSRLLALKDNPTYKPDRVPFDDQKAEKKILYQMDRVTSSVNGLFKDLNVDLS